MIRPLLLFVVFNLFFSSDIISQSLIHDPSEELNLFVPSTLKNLGVYKATVTKSFKYDLEIIKPTNELQIYEFDNEGYISKILEINPFRRRLDTIEIIYYRNKNNEITTKVKHDPKYTYVKLFKYSGDFQNKVENFQMSKTQDWNESLYPEKLMWSDSMSFNRKELLVYNQFGTLYQKFKFEKNEEGKVSEIKEYGRNNKWLSTLSLEYNEGHLINIKQNHSNKMMFDSEKQLTYGKNGLIEEKYFKNGSLEYIRKITYNNIGLPELDISRNESSKKMTIKKIKWQ